MSSIMNRPKWYCVIIFSTLLLVLTPLVSNGQEIDSILFSRIKENFERGKSVNIEFHFYFDNQFKNSLNLKKLVTITHFLDEHRDINIELRCHTDCQGRQDYLIAFSQRQAKIITSFLVAYGLNEARIKAVGMGGLYPIEECHHCKCEDFKHRRNRRIELIKIE